MTDDRIHANATKAANNWAAALAIYSDALTALIDAEINLRSVRREMKDTETFLFVNGQVSGKNDTERKANLAIALRQDEAYERLTRSEATLEKEVARHKRDADVAQETMKLNAAVLRYATEERRENAERIAATAPPA